jgi:hypothetical protein
MHVSTNNMEQNPSLEANNPQLVQNSKAFYKSRKFNIVFTKASNFFMSSRWTESTFTILFLQVDFNNIFTSTYTAS